jgi:hypothetical protein
LLYVVVIEQALDPKPFATIACRQVCVASASTLFALLAARQHLQGSGKRIEIMDGVGRSLVPRLRLVHAIIGVSHGAKGHTDRNQSIRVLIPLNAMY